MDIDRLIWTMFRERYCDKHGVPKSALNLGKFRKRLRSAYPNSKEQITAALEKFDLDVCVEILEQWPRSDDGYINHHSEAQKHLQTLRCDLDDSASEKAVMRVQERYRATAKARQNGTKANQDPSGTTTQPKMTTQPAVPANTIRPISPAQIVSPTQLAQQFSSLKSPPTTGQSDTNPQPSLTINTPIDDILAKKLKQLRVSTELNGSESEATNEDAVQRKGPDFQLYSALLGDRDRQASVTTPSSAVDRSIRQAPLLTAEVVSDHYKDLVPQYGLLGSLGGKNDNSSDSQLFLNTNVPFSAFICGVQGSGKSHTTSCILENAVLASPNIGYLKSPASTLVFSYSEWSSGGAGFNISEATFLGVPHPDFPNHHVKQVTVLYSPSNAAIKRMYERLPNVKMIPLRLKARTLDIGALHTLMAVDEKLTMPLYMATVEAILRGIASESEDGSLDYLEFKRRLAEEKFDPVQKVMLKMRMNLLESFLDLSGTAPAPSFNPGEVTIIDLSDPFLTPSTACILFKLSLEQFLQSRAPGKMVVLDEAHKYMLDTPGSKILTDHLTRIIRLQRHQGARVVISTQEPTIATELIALCSVTVMHRFTSPTWYAALRKHINAVDGDKHIMQQIESLETGEAVVYSPNAVMGKNDDGSLVKATGRLLRVNIRNRVTLDGGASIMAV